VQEITDNRHTIQSFNLLKQLHCFVLGSYRKHDTQYLMCNQTKTNQNIMTKSYHNRTKKIRIIEN